MNRLLILLIPLLYGFVSPCQSSQSFELLSSKTKSPLQRRGGNAASGGPLLSANGNLIIFASLAENMGAPRPPRGYNLYLLDRATGERTAFPIGFDGRLANATVDRYLFCGEDKKILFETRASNLVANDTNGVPDVFLWDVQSRTTTLISAGTNGSPIGGWAASPSADASRISFFSQEQASLSDTNQLADVFVRYVAEGRNELTTGSIPAEWWGNRSIPAAEISGDGSKIAFFVEFQGLFVRDLENGLHAPPLSPGLYNPEYELLVTGKWLFFEEHRGSTPVGRTANILRYDFDTAQIETWATNTGGFGVRMLETLALSGDGNSIVYRHGSGILLRREGTEPSLLASNISLSASIDLTPDGRFVTYTTIDGNGYTRAWIYDSHNGEALHLLPNPGNPLSANSYEPSASADGSFVAYVAETYDDESSTNQMANIYLWNRTNNQSQLISGGVPGLVQETMTGGASHFGINSISYDGKRVVYRSMDTIESVSNSPPVWNVFLLDRSTGQRTLLSRGLDGRVGGDRSSFQAIISGNGKRAAFYSHATNLVEPFATEVPALYVTDLETGSIHRVNVLTNFPPNRMPPPPTFSRDGRFLAFSFRANAGAGPVLHPFVFDWNDRSLSPIARTTTGDLPADGAFNALISPDGTNVAFMSRNGNLGINAAGSQMKTYVRNRVTGQLSLVFTNGPSPDFPANINGFNNPLRFSDDSKLLLFPNRHGLFEAEVTTFWTRPLEGGTNSIACTNCARAEISSDGRWITFIRFQNPGFIRHVFLRDRLTGQETMITTNANGRSYSPKITADGSHVIFECWASNLVTNDFNNDLDIFIYDRVANRVDLITRNAAGASANGASSRPEISGDSSTLIFTTFANDLAANDLNNAPDILGLEFGGLQIQSVQVVGAKLKITWNSVAGVTYKIQSRRHLDSGDWIDENSIQGEVDIPAENRFYRVVVSN